MRLKRSGLPLKQGKRSEDRVVETVQQQLLDDEFVAKFVACAQGLRHAAVPVGHAIAGMEVGDAVLAGLPDDFETISTIIHGSDHEMPLKNLVSKLLAEEQRCFTKPVAIDHEAQVFSAVRQCCVGSGGVFWRS
jgi:hypothetical protein